MMEVAMTPEAIAQMVQSSVQKSILPLCVSLDRLNASLDELAAIAIGKQTSSNSCQQSNYTQERSTATSQDPDRLSNKDFARDFEKYARHRTSSASIINNEFAHKTSSEKSGMSTISSSVKFDEERKRREIRQLLHMIAGTEPSKMVKAINTFYDCLHKLEEPPRNDFFYRLVISERFENFFSAVIMLNSVFVAFAFNWEMRNREASTNKGHHIVNFVETSFLALYVLELTLRFCGHRFYFFVNSDMKWNNFDFILVSLSCVDFITSLLTNNYSGSSVTVVRSFRLLKLARILRTLRVMKVARELAVILDSFAQCFMSLFWALVMMVFTVYVFSLVVLQGVLSWFEEYNGYLSQKETNLAIRHFGNVQQSMLSLYMAVTGGNDWALYFNIVKKTGNIYAAAYLFFTFFFAFALFNILTAVFVEKAVVAMKPDREEAIMRQRKQALLDFKELRTICQSLAVDGSGKVTREGFQEAMTNELMVSYFASVGLEVHDVQIFYDLIGEKGIETDKLVDCFIAMKGTATSMDMQKQLFEIRRLQTQLVQLQNGLRVNGEKWPGQSISLGAVEL